MKRKDAVVLQARQRRGPTGKGEEDRRRGRARRVHVGGPLVTGESGPPGAREETSSSRPARRPVELPFMKFDGKTVVSSDEAIAFEKAPGEAGRRRGRGGRPRARLGLGAIRKRRHDRRVPAEDRRQLRRRRRSHIFAPPPKAGPEDRDRGEGDGHQAGHGPGKGGSPGPGRARRQGPGIPGREGPRRRGPPAVHGRSRPREGRGRKGREGAGQGGRPPAHGRLPGIWAIGDVVAGPMLAHKAEEDGIAVAEWIAGKAGHVDWDLVPRRSYTPTPRCLRRPWRGRRQGQRSLAVNVGNSTSPRTAAPSPRLDGRLRKDRRRREDRPDPGRPDPRAGAGELIAEVVTHMEYGGSAEDLGRTIHAHPTI
jgi:dihydrolipoamide dehydrogenase